MPDELLKNFSVKIEQKIFEKMTSQGELAIYQSQPFGMLLTMNQQVIAAEQDSFIYYEMMVHPAIFSHSNPKKIAIIGPSFGILPEVLKHDSLEEIICIRSTTCIDDAAAEYFSQFKTVAQDKRVTYIIGDAKQWLSENGGTFDIIINNENVTDISSEHYLPFVSALNADGIYIEACAITYLNPQTLRIIMQNVKFAGFSDCQPLSFMQPSLARTCTLLMATRRSSFKYLREKDIFNRPFTTNFYNFDVHRASLVLPEFMRLALQLD